MAASLNFGAIISQSSRTLMEDEEDAFPIQRYLDRQTDK